MPNYYFKNISHIDLEELARDLLQEHHKIVLENFKEGKDGGADLRYSFDFKNNIIVQCKKRDNFTSLKSGIKKESKKVELLNPKRYILFTSSSLSSHNKSFIKEAFGKHILEFSDIIGREDINNLLGLYPQIEKKHYKLWLPSSNILRNMISNHVYNRSCFDLSRIEKDIRVYVYNDSYTDAIKILNDNKVIIISGIPGIGKSLLAKILIYKIVDQGYDLFSISNDIDEAEQNFSEDAKQVFYYDDFLGTNFLVDKLNKNESRRILNFIKKINTSKTKMLIFTTREYILSQAKTTYSDFVQKEFDYSKILIDLEAYTKIIRAKILYNHLFYSELPKSYISEVLKDNRYLTIINHKNYSPRIIEHYTNNKYIERLNPSEYYKAFFEGLNNPAEIWNHAFDHQIQELSRFFLFILMTAGEPLFISDIFIMLETLCIKYSLPRLTQLKFDITLKELENTFILIQKEGKELIVKFFNPSIEDFLVEKLKNENFTLEQIINSAIYFNQYFTIFTITPNTHKIQINDNLGKLIFERLRTDYLTISSVHLVRVTYNGSNKSEFKRESLFKIDKLLRISSFYGKNNSEVNNFIIKELSNIDFDEEISSNWELTNLVRILENLKATKHKDIKTIIQNMVNSEAIYFIDDLRALITIKKSFNKIYTQLLKTKPTLFSEKIEKVIDNEFSEIGYNDKSISKYEEFLDELKDIENEFDISLDVHRDQAQCVIEELKEENSEEMEYPYDDYESNGGSDHISDVQIIGMFETLK